MTIRTNDGGETRRFESKQRNDITLLPDGLAMKSRARRKGKTRKTRRAESRGEEERRKERSLSTYLPS